MKYILLFYFFIVYQKITAQDFSLTSIKVLNLKEDKGPFATFNDEVCILSAVYSLNNDSLYYWKLSPIISLSDSINSQTLNINFNLLNDSSTSLFVALIELDNNITSDSLNSLLYNSFKKYRFHPQNFIQGDFETILKNNDLLGFTKLKFKQLIKRESVLTFKGLHIFNRFHYEIYFKEQ